MNLMCCAYLLAFPNQFHFFWLVLSLATPVPARPTFRVEKLALFYNPASGSTFSSTAIEIIKWVKKIAVAQAKVSHILRPGNTAFKEQLKLVNGLVR
jgi:hypothetical protein